MMQCPDIIKTLEQLAPLEAAAPWDNSGVQVIGGKEEISCLAVVLDPSPENIDKALRLGADFILSHHPLCFEPFFLNENNSHTRIVRKLMQAGVCLYSAHTSLDGEPAGPVRWLAWELGLSNIQMLEPLAEGSPYGFGYCGALPQKQDFKNFITNLSGHLTVNRLNICGKAPEAVENVACCPGSGAGMWKAAKALGADVLITGDVKYHVALDTEVCIIDVGHFSLEEEMMLRFAKILEQKLAGVKVVFIEARDPIQPYTI